MNSFPAPEFKAPRRLGMVTSMDRSRPLSTVALIGVLVAALGLAACGRKSGLDLPPAASAAPANQSAQNQDRDESKGVVSPISKPPKSQPRVVPNRRLPIDVLLD